MKTNTKSIFTLSSLAAIGLAILALFLPFIEGRALGFLVEMQTLMEADDHVGLYYLGAIVLVALMLVTRKYLLMIVSSGLLLILALAPYFAMLSESKKMPYGASVDLKVGFFLLVVCAVALLVTSVGLYLENKKQLEVSP